MPLLQLSPRRLRTSANPCLRRRLRARQVQGGRGPSWYLHVAWQRMEDRRASSSQAELHRRAGGQAASPVFMGLGSPE